MASGSTGSTLPRWQLALLLGAPVALTLGYLYYRQSSVQTSGDSKKRGKLDKLDKSISIDESGEKFASSSTNNKSKGEEKAPTALALEYKNKGNELFRQADYQKAIEFYDKAIHHCPSTNLVDLATFYQNRAAAYEQIGNWEMVRDDCTKALELNMNYTKAYYRRAKAFEKLGKLEMSLEDLTATCILEKFANSSTLVFADRVLKSLGASHAKVAMASRKPVLPSKHFVKSFFSTFSNDPIQKVVVVGSAEPKGLLRAKIALEESRFDDVVAACNDELALSEAESDYKWEALLLRATMYELTGEFDKALVDFNAVLDTTADRPNMQAIKVNAFIKRATIHLQMDQLEKCFEDFEKALAMDANNADVYYHRGQMYSLVMRHEDAKADFEKTMELRPDYSLAYIQKLYVEYRLAMMQEDQMNLLNLLEGFKAAIDMFPSCVECFSILAQILTEQGQYEEANQFYERALKLDPENAPIHVHQAILTLQWKCDVEQGMKMLYNAIKVDDRCGFAFETLASVEVQRGALEKAIELFEKAITLAKSETEIAHLFSLKDAAIAQINVSRRMNIDVASLASLAASSI